MGSQEKTILKTKISKQSETRSAFSCLWGVSVKIKNRKMSQQGDVNSARKNDVRLGDVVLIPGHRLGIVRYIGPVHFGEEGETYFGVELKGHTEEDHGCNGTVDGNRYFQCKHEKSGVFVKKISRIITPEEILKKLAELNEKLLLCTCQSAEKPITTAAAATVATTATATVAAATTTTIITAPAAAVVTATEQNKNVTTIADQNKNESPQTANTDTPDVNLNNSHSIGKNVITKRLSINTNFNNNVNDSANEDSDSDDETDV
ncbi:CAP-Gly domain-containing linker protein [Reticulomyxa filosa]|uniref:CAP-Gly domain-containing linker protein n=1 Tax=Reticulomyxa filosa TaxID=46433 RepID=X6NIM6_RETFI|nr:CAP-Gly domain-containing linker protein [Reticulomyxa filosa]|eukprot:ETO25579.1 CAP-Gly domain-containing linker protein [Reticulomyxa filosa]